MSESIIQKRKKGKKVSNPAEILGNLNSDRPKTTLVVPTQQENTLVEEDNFDSLGEVDVQYDSHPEQSEADNIGRLSPASSRSVDGVPIKTDEAERAREVVINNLLSQIYDLQEQNSLLNSVTTPRLDVARKKEQTPGKFFFATTK